jgi:hypothetical protein
MDTGRQNPAAVHFVFSQQLLIRRWKKWPPRERAVPRQPESKPPDHNPQLAAPEGGSSGAMELKTLLSRLPKRFRSHAANTTGGTMSNRLLMMLLASSLALGQQPGGQSPALQRMQWMSQQLQLTESQKDKITPVLIEEAPKAKAVKADATLTQNEKVAKMLRIRSETDDKIRPLLNPVQQQKLDQIRQQERQQILQELSH